jgi:DNA-binding LytR/AlgR family response regulator
MTLKGFLAKLPPHRFAKPHNSFFVSLAKVDLVVRKNIYLSGSRKDEVLHITQEFVLNFNRAYEVYKQNYGRRG